MKIIAWLIVVVLAVAGLEWHVHSRGYAAGVSDTQAAADRKVAAAESDTALARAERDAANVSLANVQRSLDAQRAQLQVANTIADAALVANATLQDQLTAATAARTAAMRKAAHDSPDCADLARLPVCPAVAERLWGQAADQASPGPHH